MIVAEIMPIKQLYLVLMSPCLWLLVLQDTAYLYHWLYILFFMQQTAIVSKYLAKQQPKSTKKQLNEVFLLILVRVYGFSKIWEIFRFADGMAALHGSAMIHSFINQYTIYR